MQKRIVFSIFIHLFIYFFFEDILYVLKQMDILIQPGSTTERGISRRKKNENFWFRQMKLLKADETSKIQSTVHW